MGWKIVPKQRTYSLSESFWVINIGDPSHYTQCWHGLSRPRHPVTQNVQNRQKYLGRKRKSPLRILLIIILFWWPYHQINWYIFPNGDSSFSHSETFMKGNVSIWFFQSMNHNQDYSFEYTHYTICILSVSSKYHFPLSVISWCLGSASPSASVPYSLLNL